MKNFLLFTKILFCLCGQTLGPNAMALIGADSVLDLDISKTQQVALYLNDELLCGATAINEKILITAAHCVDKNQNIKINYKFLLEDYWFIINDKNTLIHNDLDLALIDLPTKLPTHRINFSVAYSLNSQKILAVGFGCQSLMFIGQEWILGTSGELNGAYLKKVKSDEQFYQWFSQIFDGTTPALCPGDSGSGLFLKLNEQEFSLIGVNSHIGLQNSLQEGISRATRIDSAEVNNWIKQFIKNHNYVLNRIELR